MNTADPPCPRLFTEGVSPAMLDAVKSEQDEAHKVSELEMTLRLFAGGRDGARAIEWARAEYALEKTRPSNRRLSCFLQEAYSRFVRGAAITVELEWRIK